MMILSVSLLILHCYNNRSNKANVGQHNIASTLHKDYLHILKIYA